MQNISAHKFIKFQIKIPRVAEKTTKNFRGLLYFAAPCRTENISRTKISLLCM